MADFDPLADYEPASDRSPIFEDEPDLPETESKELISANLLAQVNDLITGGARIESVTNEEQFQNSVGLLRIVKRTASDLESERKKAVDPLNARVKEINSTFKEKSEALDSLARNLQNVGGAYQLELQREADRKRKEAEEKAALERRKLAEEENKRLEEEEAKRRAAAAAIEAAEKENDAAKRAELIAHANQANDEADAALKAATTAAVAVDAVKVQNIADAPKRRGFSAKIVHSANVTDVRAALKAIVDGGEWGYIESAALTKCVESACNKIATRQGEKFNWPGCSLVSAADARVRY